jgi:hypothetical protein
VWLEQEQPDQKSWLRVGDRRVSHRIPPAEPGLDVEVQIGCRPGWFRVRATAEGTLQGKPFSFSPPVDELHAAHISCGR